MNTWRRGEEGRRRGKEERTEEERRRERKKERKKERGEAVLDDANSGNPGHRTGFQLITSTPQYMISLTVINLRKSIGHWGSPVQQKKTNDILPFSWRHDLF